MESIEKQLSAKKQLKRLDKDTLVKMILALYQERIYLCAVMTNTSARLTDEAYKAGKFSRMLNRAGVDIPDSETNQYSEKAWEMLKKPRRKE